jgi:hypothetical protein
VLFLELLNQTMIGVKSSYVTRLENSSSTIGCICSVFTTYQYCVSTRMRNIIYEYKINRRSFRASPSPVTIYIASAWRAIALDVNRIPSRFTTMNNPPQEIYKVLNLLSSNSSADSQKAAIATYFVPEAGFACPVFIVKPGLGSRKNILSIYRYAPNALGRDHSSEET